MDKKSYIQISITFIIILIIAIVYFSYFKDSNIKQVNNEINQKEQKIVKGSEDLITKMSYFSEDIKGNRYEINSETGVINPDNSNLILMDQVTAVIFLINGEKILISSKKATYNDDNNDTTFSGSVDMVYGDHKINAENMDLSFKNQTAVLYDKVNYKSSLSMLSADKILVNFLNKYTKIEMNDENNNILIQSSLKNVGN